MGWSIFAQGSKTHVRATVEAYKPKSFYPPQEEQQVDAAKAIILASIAGCPDNAAVFVDANGSMQVSIGGNGANEIQIQHVDMKVQVRAVKLTGMSPND
jgi:hypothetical protein